ncbi:MAG: hypothetical protein WBA50_02900, partial [Mycobacterium sp.]
MSNPPGPPQDESPWARPTGQPEPQGGATPPRPPEPSASPTQQMPAGRREEATTRIPAAPAQPPVPPQA